MKKTVFYVLAVVLMMACSTPAQYLTILHTNDTHSQVEPDEDSDSGGYARRMGLIKQEREADPELLLLDAGDFSQGTPYFNYYHGRVEIEAMNWMGYDAATLGNHEFDNGLDTLAMVLKRANFPIVCANYDVTGTPLEGLVKPYVILNKKDVKVGVFGMGCYPYSVIDTANFSGIKYLDSYQVAQEMADTLRAQGCEVVICLSHMGTLEHGKGEPCDSVMVTKTRGIDVVIGGHTHDLKVGKMVPNLDGDSIPLSQMKKAGYYMGKIMLYLDDKNEK